MPSIRLWWPVWRSYLKNCLRRRAFLRWPGPSLRGLCHAIGAAFVLGAEVRVQELSASRFVRPLDPRKKRAFLQSPCEIGAEGEPVRTSPRISAPPVMAPAAFPAAATSRSLPASHSAQDTLRNLVAER